MVAGSLTGEVAAVAQPHLVPIGGVSSSERWRSHGIAEQSASQSSSLRSQFPPVPDSIMLNPDVLSFNEEAGRQIDQLSGRGTSVQTGAHSASRKRARSLDVYLAAGAALDKSELTGDAIDRILALELLWVC